MTKELLDYFEGDELASNAYLEKYKLEGESTPDDTHKRMAKEFYRVDKYYQSQEHKADSRLLSDYGQNRENLTEDSIYLMFKGFKYIIPQGSIMSQLGNDSVIGSLSNCVVIESPEDSYAGIMKTDEELAQAMKRRCGVGFELSSLRPKSALVSNSAKTSTGAVSFMSRFSNTTREVAQGGRRGALMISMDVRHPDILDFIASKRDLTMITGANISVKFNDEFFNAVINNDAYCLRFPIDKEPIKKMDMGMNIMYAHDDGYVKWVMARDVYNEFIDSNHASAEPGLLSWDRTVQYSPDSVYPQYLQKSTNPCSEIAMPANDSCRLIVLNLTAFVINPYTKNAMFDYVAFYKMAYEQQRLADNIIDLEVEKIDKILAKVYKDNKGSITGTEYQLWTKLKEVALDGRRTGCGFTGLGDVIAQLGEDYGSDSSKSLVERIMFNKMKGELDCGIDLAILRGTFKGWDASKEINGNDFYVEMERLYPEIMHKMREHGRRNVSWSTVAPTGTVSIMAQTSSGIEPIFRTHYMRRKKINPNEKSRVDFVDKNGDSFTEYPVIHKGLELWGEVQSSFLPSKVSLNELSGASLEAMIKKSPYFKSTADVISWRDRVELQAIVQRYTTHSISSTINLPKTVSKEEVSDIYLSAWKNGLKGITVYREGSRDGVLISSDADMPTHLEHLDSVKRPTVLDMDLYHVTAKGDRFTIIIGLMDGKPYEVFATQGEIGKNRVNGTIQKMASGRYDISQEGVVIENITNEMTAAEISLTRLVSMGLRHRVNVKYIVEQLNKSNEFITSFSKAISRTLNKYVSKDEIVRVKCVNPECTGNGTNIVFEEGCHTCKDCGSSACG